jgi:hypothetical protein
VQARILRERHSGSGRDGNHDTSDLQKFSAKKRHDEPSPDGQRVLGCHGEEHTKLPGISMSREFEKFSEGIGYRQKRLTAATVETLPSKSAQKSMPIFTEGANQTNCSRNSSSVPFSFKREMPRSK